MTQIEPDLDLWDNFSVSKNQEIEPRDLYDSFVELSAALSASNCPNDFKTPSIITGVLQDHLAQVSEGALFRKSRGASEVLASLWLKKVTNTAKLISMGSDIPEYAGISTAELSGIAKLSPNNNSILELPEILKHHGIILIYEKAPACSKIDGAVYKLSNGTPVIGMSFRYHRLDNFWFTLLHELSHIHLHYDMLDTPILEDFDEEQSTDIEISADRLAKSSFVSRSKWRNCEPKYKKDLKSLKKFSEECSLHPAIVAGMLRHEFRDYKLFSGLINSTDTRELAFKNE